MNTNKVLRFRFLSIHLQREGEPWLMGENENKDISVSAYYNRFMISLLTCFLCKEKNSRVSLFSLIRWQLEHISLTKFTLLQDLWIFHSTSALVLLHSVTFLLTLYRESLRSKVCFQLRRWINPTAHWTDFLPTRLFWLLSCLVSSYFELFIWLLSSCTGRRQGQPWSICLRTHDWHRRQ